MKSITRHRGDDYPERVTLSWNGARLNLTGCSLLLTVNAVAHPTDEQEQLLQSVGSIVAPATDGVALFPIDVAVEPGSYFFEVEVIDATGKVKTYPTEAYTVLQDITKTDIERVFTFEDWGADGTELFLSGDGTEFTTLQWAYDYATRLVMATRDSRRVIRSVPPNGSTNKSVMLMLLGTATPKQRGFNPFVEHVEFGALVYVNEGSVAISLRCADQYSYAEASVGHNDSDAGITEYSAASLLTPADAIYVDDSALDAAGQPGWYRLKLYAEKGWASINCKAWPEGDAEPSEWSASAVPTMTPSIPCALSVSGYSGNVYDGTQISDIAELSFRVWR